MCIVDFSPLVSLSKIGDGAFRESNITSPDYAVQGMGQYAIDLSKCQKLKEIPPYFMYKASLPYYSDYFVVVLPSSITNIREMAFASTFGVRRLDSHHLICLAPTPPNAASNSLFLGTSSYEDIEWLYNIKVPAASVDTYKKHPFWGQHNIKAI